jgi:hypothetical protein
MFRKTMLALTATVAVAAASMIPTAASAWHPGMHLHGHHGHHGHHHHHRHRHFHGFGGFGITIAPQIASSCYEYRYVETRRGLRRMLVNVCAY